MNLEQKKVKSIKEFLIDHLSATLVYIFGSARSGNFRDDSDIDIAFLTNEDLDSYQIYKVAQELASRIDREIDLINLKEASTVFKAQIVGEGEVVFTEDEHFKNKFELRVLKEYALLNEERAPILERIKKEGKIYG